MAQIGNPPVAQRMIPDEHERTAPQDAVHVERMVDSSAVAFFTMNDAVRFDARIERAPALRHLVEANSAHIKAVSRAVGRIEYGNDRLTYLGTGFLVSSRENPNVAFVLTNRHVYEGMQEMLTSEPETTFRFNFGRELGVPRTNDARNTFDFVVGDNGLPELSGEKVDIDIDIDAVVLRLNIEGLPPGRTPLILQDQAPIQKGDQIFVIGYPGPTDEPDEDARAAMEEAFGPRLGYKRFAAGCIMEAADQSRPGVRKHSASTLGGNSGSPVVRFSGNEIEVLGIHYGGTTWVANYFWECRAIGHKWPDLLHPHPAVAPEAAPVNEAVNPDRYRNYPGYVADFLGVPLSMPTPPVESPTVKYVHHSLTFNEARKAPWVSAANIRGDAFQRIGRSNKWWADPRLPPDSQIGNKFYTGSGFDRGHQTRRLDVCWGTPKEAALADESTFCFTNACPQAPEFNQGGEFWQGLEKYILEEHALSPEGRLSPADNMVSVLTGPVLCEDDPMWKNGGVSVQIPMAFWKVVACKLGGSELPMVRVAAFLMSQKGHSTRDGTTLESYVFGMSTNAWQTYQLSIPDLEAKTGLRFSDVYHENDVMLQPQEGLARRLPTRAIETYESVVVRPAVPRPLPRKLDLAWMKEVSARFFPGRSEALLRVWLQILHCNQVADVKELARVPAAVLERWGMPGFIALSLVQSCA